MPLSNQKQGMAGMERMNGGFIGRLANSHRRDIEGPIVDAISKARSNEGLLRRLNAALFRRMDSKKLEQSTADGMVLAALIGSVTATPRENL